MLVSKTYPADDSYAVTEDDAAAFFYEIAASRSFKRGSRSDNLLEPMGASGLVRAYPLLPEYTGV